MNIGKIGNLVTNNSKLKIRKLIIKSQKFGNYQLKIWKFTINN